MVGTLLFFINHNEETIWKSDATMLEENGFNVKHRKQSDIKSGWKYYQYTCPFVLKVSW